MLIVFIFTPQKKINILFIAFLPQFINNSGADRLGEGWKKGMVGQVDVGAMLAGGVWEGSALSEKADM